MTSRRRDILRENEERRERRAAARRCHSQQGPGRGAPLWDPDALAVAEALGVYVHRLENLRDLLGMYTYRQRERHILLNARMEPGLMQLVCAHELGHDALHRQLARGGALPEFSLFDMRTAPEYEANAFAAHLLLDDDAVLEHLRQGRDVAELAALLGVHLNLVLVKLHEMNRLGWQLELPYVPRGDFLGRSSRRRGAALEERTYLAIDLKSFYASVECRERGLDPMDTNLVVADESRTDKTICLAVTPSLKTYGIPGRPRLFEVVQKMKEVNSRRQFRAPDGKLQGRSCFRSELQADPRLEADYLIAPPRMAYYVEYSTKIYRIYLKYIAPEDIVVYSIDEVFLDVTHYLKPRGMTARELAMEIILDVLSRPESRPRRGSGPICIWPRWPWILWPSGCLPTETACVSRPWTSWATEKPCGATGR